MEKPVQQNQPLKQFPVQKSDEKLYGKSWRKWILLYGVLGLLLYAIVYYFVFFKGNPTQYSFPATQTPNAITQTPIRVVTDINTQTSDGPPLLLKGIGINLDYYDQNTGRAGDFQFTKQKLQFDRLFMGYGFFIPASSASADKKNPQPTFIVPLGTPVRSLVDGVVANIPTLWSGDYSIQVTADGQMQKWVYETEHLINPRVKVGDHVAAGQIVGEVSDFDHGAPPGFGAVEIGILKGGNPPEHVCPFVYLDPSIKEDVFTKIKAFYKSWEDYRGDTTLYNEETEIPGCLTLEPIEG